MLVNILGHLAGALIFGIFLYLLLRDRAGTRLRGSRLSILAAVLAFLWNLTSLVVLVAVAVLLRVQTVGIRTFKLTGDWK